MYEPKFLASLNDVCVSILVHVVPEHLRISEKKQNETMIINLDMFQNYEKITCKNNSLISNYRFKLYDVCK